MSDEGTSICPICKSVRYVKRTHFEDDGKTLIRSEVCASCGWVHSETKVSTVTIGKTWAE